MVRALRQLTNAIAALAAPLSAAVQQWHQALHLQPEQQQRLQQQLRLIMAR
jgi:hypothetical protein